MTIDVKDQLADGEVFQRVGDDIVGLDLPAAGSTADVVPDLVTTPGSVLFNLAECPTGANGIQLAGGANIAGAKMATTEALPACTYANGASGVGATLTGDANGALGSIDTITTAADNFLLVKNQADAEENGLYEITTLGDGSNPFVLTRATFANQATDFADGVVVKVARGAVNRGTEWSVQGTTTVGTTDINFRGLARPDATPGDVFLGSGRTSHRYWTDFEELDTAIGAGVAVHIPGTAFRVATIGTSTGLTQTGSADLTFGSAQATTGTDTTGYTTIRAGRHAFTFDSGIRYRMACRLKVADVSDGSQTFTIRVGSATASLFSSGTAPANGLYFEAPADGSNWDCVAMASSTPTTTDSGVAVSSSFQVLAIWYNENTGTASFYIDDDLVASISSGLPSASIGTGMAIVKTAGTTARTVNYDFFGCSHRDPRANLLYVP
jgi:hypothetical protein